MNGRTHLVLKILQLLENYLPALSEEQTARIQEFNFSFFVEVFTPAASKSCVPILLRASMLFCKTLSHNESILFMEF